MQQHSTPPQYTFITPQQVRDYYARASRIEKKRILHLWGEQLTAPQLVQEFHCGKRQARKAKTAESTPIVVVRQNRK